MGSVGFWMVLLSPSLGPVVCVTHTNHVLIHWFASENIHNLVLETIPIPLAGLPSLALILHGYLLKQHIYRLHWSKKKKQLTFYIFLAWRCWAFIEH